MALKHAMKATDILEKERRLELRLVVWLRNLTKGFVQLRSTFLPPNSAGAPVLPHVCTEPVCNLLTQITL